jgi:hypothetical protein
MAAVCIRTPRGPMVDDVLFCREHLGNGTIAHEVFHAACQWARRLPRRYPGWALLEIAASRHDGRTEEQMARITERLTREFVADGHTKGIFA